MGDFIIKKNKPTKDSCFKQGVVGISQLILLNASMLREDQQDFSEITLMLNADRRRVQFYQ